MASVILTHSIQTCVTTILSSLQVFLSTYTTISGDSEIGTDGTVGTDGIASIAGTDGTTGIVGTMSMPIIISTVDQYSSMMDLEGTSTTLVLQPEDTIHTAHQLEVLSSEIELMLTMGYTIPMLAIMQTSITMFTMVLEDQEAEQLPVLLQETIVV